MSDVFVSFSRQHVDLTKDLVALLKHETITDEDGTTRPLTVWWDESLQSGHRLHSEITKQLDEAKAVLVIWTEGAVHSDWVYAEANRAASARKIVPIRANGLDINDIPLPFGIYRMDDADDHAAVLQSVHSRLNGERSEDPAYLADTTHQGWVLEPKHELLPAQAAARRPASLLVAKHRVVPFRDIHGLSDRFVEWAITKQSGPQASRALGRLLHGPGGSGKTRLMIEVCEKLACDHGWLAGFVPRDAIGRESSQRTLDRLIRPGRDAAPLILVVDYAEGRQDDVIWLADKLMGTGF